MSVEAGPELARAGKEPAVEVTSAWLEDRHCSHKVGGKQTFGACEYTVVRLHRWEG